MIVYSLIIPVFNSEPCLEDLVTQIVDVMDRHEGAYEIICINDASTDRSLEVLRMLQKLFPQLKVYHFSVNQGQSKALFYGVERASGAYLITMDDDLQNPPQELPKMIKALESQPDIDCVFGVADQKKHSRFRNWASLAVDGIYRCFFASIKTPTSNYRIFKRSVAHAMIANYSSGPLLSILILKTTSRVTQIRVRHEENVLGRSRYTFMGLVKLFMSNFYYLIVKKC